MYIYYIYAKQDVNPFFSFFQLGILRTFILREAQGLLIWTYRYSCVMSILKFEREVQNGAENCASQIHQS